MDHFAVPRTSRRALLALTGTALLSAACTRAIPPAPTSAAPGTTTGRQTPAPEGLPVATPTTPTDSLAITASPVSTTAASPGAAPLIPISSPTALPTLAPTSTPPAIPTTDARPAFSDVSAATPANVIAFLTGHNPDYPGSDSSKVLDFSASDILETMDTIVLDWVREARGAAGLQKVYEVIAGDILATLRDRYGQRWVLVPLDAGYGGKKGYFWDPGSEGTEAIHTRAVVGAVFELIARRENRRILLRRIYNDDIADDFGFGGNSNRASISSTLMRQARAAMLAFEARAWNAANPDPASQVMVHELSVHFNAGAGGALVLHQGNTVQPDFQARSIDFGGRYLHRVVPDLNATGLLPAPLTLWGGDGLHDDVMMYRPAYLTGNAVPANLTLRYGALQGQGYMPRFIQMVLSHNGPSNTATTRNEPAPSGLV